MLKMHDISENARGLCTVVFHCVHTYILKHYCAKPSGKVLILKATELIVKG